MSSIVVPQLRHFTAVERLSNVLFVALHVSALTVFVVPCSWRLIALAVGGYVVRMWAVPAGYHRYFAHRTYKTSRAFQLVLAILGATTMQNGPIWWASVHRRHHKFSDGPRDPHSPAHHGFWYAHIGWAFDRTVPRPRDHSNVTDLTRFPELCWVDRHDWVPLLGYGVICFAIGGVPGLVWGFVLSTLAVFHATMLINSLAHIWGSRRYATGDRSRNNAFLAVLNSRRRVAQQPSPLHELRKARVLLVGVRREHYVLRVLARLSIVWGVREPPASVLAGS